MFRHDRTANTRHKGEKNKLARKQIYGFSAANNSNAVRGECNHETTSKVIVLKSLYLDAILHWVHSHRLPITNEWLLWLLLSSGINAYKYVALDLTHSQRNPVRRNRNSRRRVHCKRENYDSKCESDDVSFFLGGQTGWANECNQLDRKRREEEETLSQCVLCRWKIVPISECCCWIRESLCNIEHSHSYDDRLSYLQCLQPIFRYSHLDLRQFLISFNHNLIVAVTEQWTCVENCRKTSNLNDM